MNKLVLLLSLFAVSARAERVEVERSRQVVELEFQLNPQTVRCLIGGYGSKSLKISAPELRYFTAFPQTTTGETAPCINAGSCQFDKTPDGRRLSPELILDPARPTEVTNVTIVLKEVFEIEESTRTCTRALREHVSAHVRGLDFNHEDGAYLGELDYDLCLKLAGR